MIDNLPAECAVEVPCHVDRNGIQPTRVGRIPGQLAGIMRLSVNVQEMAVTAALTGKREHIYHARCWTRTPPPSYRSTKSARSATS